MNQDPAELEKMLENKGEGQAALNIMNQLGMDEAQKKELFKMAGDIFENWSEGLDENNAEERIGKIKQDPKGFYDSLDDDSKNRIKEFSRGLTGKSAPQ